MADTGTTPERDLDQSDARNNFVSSFKALNLYVNENHAGLFRKSFTADEEAQVLLGLSQDTHLQTLRTAAKDSYLERVTNDPANTGSYYSAASLLIVWEGIGSLKISHALGLNLLGDEEYRNKLTNASPYLAQIFAEVDWNATELPRNADAKPNWGIYEHPDQDEEEFPEL